MDEDKNSDYDSQSEESLFSDSQTHGAFHSHFIESVRPLIELIDSLRLIGLDEDIDLPSIAVVGDQSSGKSSVLEALSGVALPRGSGIVTRCPLELKLQKLKKGPWSGTISYSGHSETFKDPLKVDRLVREAQNELAGNTVGICDELITLEISSPDVCDLTLIDLPGITRVPVNGQPEDIGDQQRLTFRLSSTPPRLLPSLSLTQSWWPCSFGQPRALVVGVKCAFSRALEAGQLVFNLVPPVPFFLEVHEELTRMWKAPYTARSRPGSSLLTTLDGGQPGGYVDVPQVEHAVVVHLYP
ncbi:interferon-induced GTP-binding protein Mx-like [Garra rufa]|uniref:interferon-induced GTP-binding protein Mx-like n=1 Tax=Garra rufa TaxID=137080 RepID=UPI003CCE5E9C